MKVFADGANFREMVRLDGDPLIEGFTTNPTLMRKAGVENYTNFCRDLLFVIRQKPISFEVFAEDQEEMIRQAKVVASWGDNVYVKIPVVDKNGTLNSSCISHLARFGIKLNVTAVMNEYQCYRVSALLQPDTPSIISVFAGRISDTGRNASTYMRRCKGAIQKDNQELLWASPRRVYDYHEAKDSGADIITMTPALIKKMRDNLNKSLWQFSIETVNMFNNDAKEAGYQL